MPIGQGDLHLLVGFGLFTLLLSSHGMSRSTVEQPILRLLFGYPRQPQNLHLLQLVELCLPGLQLDILRFLFIFLVLHGHVLQHLVGLF